MPIPFPADTDDGLGFEITGIIRGCRVKRDPNAPNGDDERSNTEELVYNVLPMAEFAEWTESQLSKRIGEYCRHFFAVRGDDIGGELIPGQAIFASEDGHRW